MDQWTEARCREVVYVRSNGVCELCGRRRGNSVHHRNKQGRQWTPGNALHLCGHGTVGCHSWIEHHPRHAMALGLWVPRAVEPLGVPMYVRPAMFVRGWWFADDDGMWTWLDDQHPPADTERAAAVAALTVARLIG